MPFEPPCFAPAFFFDPEVLGVLRGAMDDRIVADQWGCDVPLRGSDYQGAHADYQRPLFSEAPDLLLPAYMQVVSFGLAAISKEHGPIEIAPGTHQMPRNEAMQALAVGEIAMQPVTLQPGDVLIRHPWALHRGTPNVTETPRALVTIRYVRNWYADDSREVRSIPGACGNSDSRAAEIDALSGRKLASSGLTRYRKPRVRGRWFFSQPMDVGQIGHSHIRKSCRGQQVSDGLHSIPVHCRQRLQVRSV